MSERELMEAAIRVLRAWNSRGAPPEEDLGALRTARPLLAHLPADEIACKVVESILGDLSPLWLGRRAL